MYKIWEQPTVKGKAFANADGNSPAAVDPSPCNTLMMEYQNAHAAFVAAKDVNQKKNIEHQMRTILNQMREMGCGKDRGNTSSFTGTCCGDVTASNQTPNTSSTCCGGVYGTLNSGAFSVNNGISPFRGGVTCIWNNPNGAAAVCGVNCIVMAPVCAGSPTQVMTSNVPSLTTNCTAMTSCVPVAQAPSNAPSAAASVCTSAPAAPAPAPYVKPTFLQWIARGFKA